MILLIDNYDSFVHNLARYVVRLGLETRVERNDAIDAAGVAASGARAALLSPGPCDPERAGCSLDVVRKLYDKLPILGVCLGHQAIAAALGGRVVRAREPMHGRTSLISHDGRGVFDSLPNPLDVCRYHSLTVEASSLPPSLQVTARAADGDVMAIAHRDFPVVGVQFHPEAILTEGGYDLLANFFRLAGIHVADCVPQREDELTPTEPAAPLPLTPVTF